MHREPRRDGTKDRTNRLGVYHSWRYYGPDGSEAMRWPTSSRASSSRPFQTKRRGCRSSIPCRLSPAAGSTSATSGWSARNGLPLTVSAVRRVVERREARPCARRPPPSGRSFGNRLFTAVRQAHTQPVGRGGASRGASCADQSRWDSPAPIGAAAAVAVLHCCIGSVRELHWKDLGCGVTVAVQQRQGSVGCHMRLKILSCSFAARTLP